ncbi:hypothetical protein ALI144C_36985 [Actinosynnema sp. ALI-1.44]|uniref:carboxylate-amine ligase n=1 Tax=Actinosynnema sp. ALI-1.44 TaxID=1933779 RepID=UPI00097BB2A2|nr:YbdK family carboxylate-amine ligase [Actinosynnema sp. ALI-1.44]ONI76260.1 hypothetical protein ALI144C_36985 [Actinosynnema sp. ALI-1.44]
MTCGVEEEFLLVDVGSRKTVSRADTVIKRVDRTRLPTGAHVHHELLNSQVEFATGVCMSAAEVRRQLVAGRAVLAAAAREEGLALVSAGTAVLSGPDVAVTEGERYHRITATYARVMRDYQVSGCHVHIGLSDRDTAVAVINHLAFWLPSLLALSANSPFDHGRDTGYASWRTVQQSLLPGNGLTPWFSSAADYDTALAQLVDCGVLVDESMNFWLARPSPRYPTVEVRVADAVATADEAVLQTLLTDGLVQHALTELASGKEAPPLPEHLRAAAVWTASRYGMEGPAIDLRSGRQVPARYLLTELIDLVRPYVEVRDLVRGVLVRGTGVQRQRRAGGPAAAVDELIALATMEEM